MELLFDIINVKVNVLLLGLTGVILVGFYTSVTFLLFEGVARSYGYLRGRICTISPISLQHLKIFTGNLHRNLLFVVK